MQATFSEKTHYGLDKTKRYGWVTKDAPGDLRLVNKDLLRIHPAYQRDAIMTKVTEITANWSWVGCGAIVVGLRDSEFWVIDGQHRVLAAKRRSDITHLPCVVFQTENVKQEAVAFLDLNTGRKPVSSIGKFKAMIAAGDRFAAVVDKTLDELGITAKATANKAGELKSIGWSLRKAAEDEKNFRLVMRTAAELSHDLPIMEKLLDGLWYINERLPEGIADRRFSKRLRDIGARRLIEAAGRSAAYFSRGGARVWAMGMMDEINKGLRNKYVLRDEDAI